MPTEPPAPSAEVLPAAIERRADTVRILDLRLPVTPAPGPLAPDLASFGHFTPDPETMVLLHFVASELALRHPVMLEGPTSTPRPAGAVPGGPAQVECRESTSTRCSTRGS